MRHRLAAVLALLAMSTLAATRIWAGAPNEMVDRAGPGSTIVFDVTTGAPPTCSIEPGAINNVSYGFPQPDAFTSVAVRVPACATCPEPQTLDLKTISFRIRWLQACTAQAEVSVVGAVQGSGCLVPDPAQVLCGPTLHTLTGTGSVGIIHALPIPTGCCVSGAAFVRVRFIGLDNCAAAGMQSPPLTGMVDACVNCQAFFTTAISAPTPTDWCSIVPLGLWWRIEADCCSVTGIGPHLSGSQGLQLAVAPNPATVKAELIFDVGSESDARLEIFDLAGRRCATLVAGRFGDGPHRATWGGDLDGGGIASPGVYRACLTTREGTLTRHILWLPR